MNSNADISTLSGFFPSQDIQKIIDGKVTQIINAKPLNNIKGKQFLLCDSEYAYGIISFSSAAKRVRKTDIQIHTDSIGLTSQAIDSIWPKRRHYYLFNIDVSRFPRKKPINRISNDGPISAINDKAHKKNVIVDSGSPEDIDKIQRYPLKIRLVEMN